MKQLLFLIVSLAGLACAQIGEPVDALLAGVSDYRTVKTVLGYSTLTDFSFDVEERGGVVASVSGRGPLSEDNIAFSSELIGVASGYGEGIATPVADFFRGRIGELAGQGPVDLALEQYILNVEVTGAEAPYGLEFELYLSEIDTALFPATTHALGPADAPIVIREFSDFQCPFCARFAAGPFQGIKQDLLARGDVRFEYHHFPLISIHPNAFPAAEAAECVTAANNEDAFWTYHDALFERQAAWQALPEPNSYFVRLAEDVGLSSDGVETCLAEREFAVAIDDAYKTAGETLRISGTPSVFVNGFRVANFNDINSYLSAIKIVEAFNAE